MFVEQIFECVEVVFVVVCEEDFDFVVFEFVFEFVEFFFEEGVCGQVCVFWVVEDFVGFFVVEVVGVVDEEEVVVEVDFVFAFEVVVFDFVEDFGGFGVDVEDFVAGEEVFVDFVVDVVDEGEFVVDDVEVVVEFGDFEGGDCVFVFVEGDCVVFLGEEVFFEGFEEVFFVFDGFCEVVFDVVFFEEFEEVFEFVWVFFGVDDGVGLVEDGVDVVEFVFELVGEGEYVFVVVEEGDFLAGFEEVFDEVGVVLFEGFFGLLEPVFCEEVVFDEVVDFVCGDDELVLDCDEDFVGGFECGGFFDFLGDLVGGCEEFFEAVDFVGDVDVDFEGVCDDGVEGVEGDFGFEAAVVFFFEEGEFVFFFGEVLLDFLFEFLVLVFLFFELDSEGFCFVDEVCVGVEDFFEVV